MIRMGRKPDHPVLFRDDGEMVVYRHIRGIKAYGYDGDKAWSVSLPGGHSAYSLASHRIGSRLVLSSFEVKDDLPRIAHYCMGDGTLLGITDLGDYVDME